MTTNHFSTEAPWWANHHQQNPSSRNPKNPSQICPHPMNFTTNQSLSLNLNHEDHSNGTSNEELQEQITYERGDRKEDNQEYHSGDEQVMSIKEFLFEKPLTPSDVGKLNRLVIPKQHAEKYFPLNGNNNNIIINNESGGEKGLLLTFEDELAKSWKFRYSYWNSSQSYVLTKGWSRFVKEKKLDAGDIVFFERHRFDGDGFFIGWRRRGGDGGGGGGGGGGWNHTYPHPLQSLQHQQHPQGSGSASICQPKTLRLFGVNMECQTDDVVESESDTGSTLATQGSAQYQYYHHQEDQQYNYSISNAYLNNHMDLNISEDFNK